MDISFDGAKQALEFVKGNAPSFSTAYGQLIDLWPAVSASNDDTLINEWMDLKGRADGYMYIINKVDMFVGALSDTIKSVFGLSGITDDALLRFKQYFGTAQLAMLVGAPAYMMILYSQMTDFIQSAPDRMYSNLVASGMDSTTASQTVQQWMQNQQDIALRPGLSDNIATIVKWGAIAAAIWFFSPMRRVSK